MDLILQKVLTAYGMDAETAVIKPFGNGLINRTWKVSTLDSHYILQRINDNVFANPADIDFNTQLLAHHFSKQHPHYLFVSPLAARNRKTLLFVDQNYYRLLPFVTRSHTVDVVQTPQQAFEAAKMFGRFTRLSSGLDAALLKTTIPHFHDLGWRYQQFLSAIENASDSRKNHAKELTAILLSHEVIVEQYRAIQNNAGFKLRVTHHDTKISNVLFDDKNEGLCVIDLDTVMPGHFISDVGDMMRTYLSPVSEEEKAVSKVEVRTDFYKAIMEGYSSEMRAELTGIEKTHFFFAGQFSIYMQALRFLTDYLNNDRYYGAAYDDQNLVRARNQTALLQQLLEKKAALRN